MCHLSARVAKTVITLWLCLIASMTFLSAQAYADDAQQFGSEEGLLQQPSEQLAAEDETSDMAGVVEQGGSQSLAQTDGVAFVGDIEDEQLETVVSAESASDSDNTLTAQAQVGEPQNIDFSETLSTMATGQKAPLEEGEYVIRAAVGGFVLDVSGGSSANGANVQIYEYNATEAQKWRISYDEDGYYVLKNVKSGKLLDLSGAKTANGSNIQQYKGNDTLAQKWLLVELGNGFKIVSAKDKTFVLDVAGAKATNGTNVQLYKSNGTLAQQFIFMPVVGKSATASVKYDTPIAKGDYVIQSGVSGQYVLDVSGGSSASGANVQIYAYNATNAQKWHVEFDSNGYYTLTSKASGNVLDLSGAKAWYGSNVQQYKSNETKAQRWIITEEGGRYKLASAIDPFFVLDISGARAANGANVQSYFDNGTNAQRFTFVQLNPALPANDDIADGVYEIAVKSNSSFVLDVSGGSAANGANIQLYKRNDTYAQRWGVIRGTNGLYSIFNMASGKMLDVKGGNPLSGINVQQYASNDSKAQQWAIAKNGTNGSYTIYSALSGMSLDVSGAKFANGSNIQAYTPNGSAAQSFTFVSKPLVEERSYVILATLGTNMAVDVPSASLANGKPLQLYTANDTLAQHVLLKSAGNGRYTMQLVGSAKYITAEGNSITQRTASSGASQQWIVSLVKDGIVFKNVATGKYMSSASASPNIGTALTSSTALDNKAKFGLRTCNLVGDGLYTLTVASSASGRVLDVAGGSWSSGANAQLYAANGSNAQKFAIKHVSGDYYRVAMALSGLSLDVKGGSKDAGANVQLYAWNGSDAQLWKLELTDTGFVLTNKGSSLVLGVAGGADKNSANVDQERPTGAASQAWMLTSTSINISDVSSMAKLVRAVSGSGGPTASFSVGSGNWNALMNALYTCWDNGYSVGFLLTDIQSGNYVSLNADRTYYGASTMKAAYVTWIFQQLIEPGYVSWGDVSDLITATIVDSDNNAYWTLRSWYGSDGFNSWLGAVGLSGWGDSYYTFYTPRELQLMWVRMLGYEQSGGSYVGTWRQTFNHSYYSMIYYELGGGSRTTYSKPGWYPREGDYGALDDSGIVITSDGRRYLLTVMSDIDCYGGEWIERQIVHALNAIFEASPKV